MLERPAERPFNAINEIETARLVCDICTPRLTQMHANERWLGARLALQAPATLKRLVSPEHTWIKLTGLTACIVLVLLTFAKGDYRIETPFVLQAPVRQVVVAPFDSFIRKIMVDPGDTVEAGRSRLGELDASQQKLELAALKAERLGYEKQKAAAMRDGETAEAQIAAAQSQKCTAQIQLLEQTIAKATLVAPITGRVVSEDLKRRIGAPVQTGDILFEIARIENLRAELYVPEESISYVKVGQKGQLATVGRPDQRIGFEVDRIHPMAEVVNDKNVFRVRARLEAQFAWMRPGMEGIAKIGVAEKSFLWIGSHRLANWLRMKLWL
jgi:multidrug efflux pump subunit AcrA (membrane-fusion protein)